MQDRYVSLLEKALRAACIRMPEREECAAQVTAAMAQLPVQTRSSLLEILGAMGGTKALETMVAAVSFATPAAAPSPA